jgi:hypothetical protein
MLHRNRTAPALPATTIEVYDPVADLDRWDGMICELNIALRDAAGARLALDAEALALERLEAGAALTVEGRNEGERKARLVLMLADDTRYQAHLAAHQDARRALLDAERRAEVCRQRCRLLRVSLTLTTEDR